MSRWLKVPLIATIVVIGLLLLSMLIVPWQIKQQGSSWIAENTDRTLTIEKVSFNPFTLTIEISGNRLTEPNSDQTFVAFERLMLSANIMSLFKQAIILDRIELVDLFVNIELLGKQEFNFSDFTRLGSDKPEPVATTKKKPLHFSLNNIILTGGSIDFTDLTSAKKSQHQIRELALNLPFVGNIPYLIDDYVKPSLSLFLNGAEISASGQLKPFHNSMKTDLSLRFENIDLAFYAFHAPVPLPLEVKQGLLDLEIDLSYLVSQTEKPRLILGGKLALADIELCELDGQKLFQMPSMHVDLDWVDLFNLDFNLAAVDIYAPELYVDRDSSGQWNFQRIMQIQQTTSTTEENKTVEETATGSLPLLVIEKLSLIDGQVHYQDDFVPGGFSEKIGMINLELNRLSTHLQQKTTLTMKLQTDRNFTTKISGKLGINPVTAGLNLQAEELPLKPYYPYLESWLTAPIEGHLNFAGQIIYTENGNLQVQQGQLNLRELQVPFSDKDLFYLADFSITGSTFDLQQQHINLGSIKLKHGNIRATRLADGSLSPLQLLREQPSTEDSTAAATREPAPAWNLQVESFDLQKFKLLLTDASQIKKPQINISDLNFHAKNLSYPDAEKSPFSLDLKTGKNGTIKGSGTVIHTPLQLQANTLIKSLSLADFNNFVPERVNLYLKDGKFYSTLAIDLKQQPDKLSGSFSGKINISNFNLRNPLSDGELLVWENLNLAGIDGEISPFALHINEISLSNYLANIEIDPAGRINLTSITITEDTAETDTEPEKSKTMATEPITTSVPPDIRIDALTLQGGTVSFTDRHLPDTFSTTMYKLGGRVTGLASAEEMQADVDLRGELENHSPLTISGRINPLSQNLFADLTLSFKDIDLTPMTPYSGTYLGYVIDKGKLNLDLNYQIENQQVEATNRVMIDQFTFGESVASDKATSLPVAFAIALLKDSNNEIHLDIPVSGNLNDPDFSIGGVVFTVLKNLLVKAATSPFALLGAMLGGDEDFTSISFASGIAKIDAEQLAKLGSLAEILSKRPALTLEISGFVDQNLDPEGYRQEQLRQMLVAAKWRQLQEAGVAPALKEEIVINPEEYHAILLTVYKEAEFPRPRNFIGILEKLPDLEMEKLLLANIMAEEEQLQGLAKARTMAVRDALVAVNEEIKSRIFLQQIDIYQPPKDGTASRVEFNISSK